MKPESKFQFQYDLCIIGSGPAGIMVALEYSRLNPDKKVLLVEFGTKKRMRENSLDTSIQIKNPVNHHAPEECTNKGLGGTSASWGGRCVMFDEVDFRDRPVLKGGCTWDTDLLHELQEYLQPASTYFECGKAAFNLHDYPQYRHKRMAEGFMEGEVTDSCLERWSMPTRFGKRYLKEISACSNLSLLEGYEAREFSVPKINGEVRSLKVRRTGTDECGEVSAKSFVLAAGAQESTRILLRNLHLFNLLDGPPPALGKYYQGHISGKIASVRFKGDPEKTDYGFMRDVDGTYMRRRFQFSTAYLLEKNLLNTAIWLDNPLYYDPAHHSGAMSFIYMAMLMPWLGKKLAPPAIAHSVTKGRTHEMPKHILNILKDLPGSFSQPAALFFRRYCLKRKLPGVFLYNPKNRYALHFHAEQVPDASNRMVLGPDGESLEIHYNLSDADVESVIRLHETLDTCLRKSGCGELEFWYNARELPDAIRASSQDGIHQTGTTRIGDSPETGVVDRNLKVWGTSNVYVCSSSAFPTSGQANPTFMLGVFAVRLSRFLSRKVPAEKDAAEALY